LGGQPRLHLKGVGSQRSSNIRVPFYLCVHALSQNYKMWRGNTCQEGHVSWGEPRLPSKESWVPALPNFGVIYTQKNATSTCTFLTQKDQIRHGDQCGCGMFLGQSHHCVCTNASRGLSVIAVISCVPM